MKVLTVDDDDIVLEMLNLVLAQAGHEVVSARNGKEAIEVLRAGQCRMVITDWEMPIMNGLELCKAIRAEQFAGYIYTIILTSHTSVKEAVAGLSAGADDYVSKPFNPEELTVRIRTGERILSLETRDIAIFAMAKLAESRDPETGAHLERVRTYCRTLSQWLADQHLPGYEIDAPFTQTIYLTSPLHDIGKIGIPDCVLLKPGRLSDREFEIMKTHTTLGAGTLNAALEQFPDAKFLLMARDIALGHHERFDGTGYPGGLVGGNIPLCARIVALADVYDALTSKRIYKNAFGHDVARSIITEESGSHFDPRVISAFLGTEQEFLKTRNRFAELPVAA
jgi:putative two-component system response regulator